MAAHGFSLLNIVCLLLLDCHDLHALEHIVLRHLRLDHEAVHLLASLAALLLVSSVFLVFIAWQA